MFTMLYAASLIVTVIAGIVIYAARAFGEAYVFRVMGLKWWWIAWIPVINFLGFWGAYSIRENSGYFRVGEAKVPGWLIGLWPVWRVLLRQIPFVGWLLALAVRIFCFGTECGYVYGIFDDGTPGLMTTRSLGFLSGLIGAIPIWRFIVYRITGRRPLRTDRVVYEEWV